MNCQQFDQRVQQQLDDRSNLILDAALQKHARECSQCALYLSLYDCLDEAYSHSSGDNEFEPVSLNESAEPTRRSSYRYWKLLGSAVAASLMLMILPLLNAPQDQRNPSPGFAGRLESPEPVPVDRTQIVPSKPVAITLDDLRNINVWEWVPEEMPVTLNLSYVPAVSLPTISDINVSSFVPRRPMNAMRMLPSTIETIEPIYWYTSDLPGVKGFSSGINCTLTFLWHNIPNLGQSSDSADPAELDLGLRRYLLTHSCC